MRRPPLEYGDNFPVATGSWNPAVPWKFPHHETQLQRRSALSVALPWVTLGLGVTLGILWMSWRFDGMAPAPGSAPEGAGSEIGLMRQKPSPVQPPASGAVPGKAAPRSQPVRAKSHLA